MKASIKGVIAFLTLGAVAVAAMVSTSCTDKDPYGANFGYGMSYRISNKKEAKFMITHCKFNTRKVDATTIVYDPSTQPNPLTGACKFEMEYEQIPDQEVIFWDIAYTYAENIISGDISSAHVLCGIGDLALKITFAGGTNQWDVENMTVSYDKDATTSDITAFLYTDNNTKIYTQINTDAADATGASLVFSNSTAVQE